MNGDLNCERMRGLLMDLNFMIIGRGLVVDVDSIYEIIKGPPHGCEFNAF